MKKYVDNNNIIAGITTHGAIFSEPGIVEHTGIGDLVIGGFEEKNSIIVKKLKFFIRPGSAISLFRVDPTFT